MFLTSNYRPEELFSRLEERVIERLRVRDRAGSQWTEPARRYGAASQSTATAMGLRKVVSGVNKAYEPQTRSCEFI